MNTASKTLFEDLKEQTGGKVLCTLQEASTLSGISQMTLRRGIWERKLEARQPRGRKYVISLRDLAKFINGEN